MEKTKILSICIPTYNRKDKLDTCLSFLLDDYKGLEEKIEIVISDNCSTDNTEGLVKEKYPIFYKNYFRTDKNYGAYKNFYNVVLMATGKFVWLIGDDDIILPGIIQQLVELIENDNSFEYIMVNDYNWKPESNNQSNLTKEGIINLVSSKKVNISVNDFKTRYVNKVIDFVEFRQDAFTPIYSNIMLREHWVETNKLGFESSKKYKRFSNLLSCNANSFWIVKNLYNRKGLYFGTPALLVSFDVGWSDYLMVWFFKILPELYSLEKKYGADEGLIRKYKSEWLKFSYLIIESFKKDNKNKQASFDFLSFVLYFHDSKNFWPNLFVITKEYLKSSLKKIILRLKTYFL